VNLPLEIMKKLGLDYDTLRGIKEEIILVMASAFGPDGPYTDRVGFDGVVQAMSGSMSLTGFENVPVRSIVSWVDYGTALHAAFGAMTALYERLKTGRGQLIDVSLLATGVTFMQPLLMERDVTGIKREQKGNTSFYTAPSDVYRARDGWIIVPTIGSAMFRRWCRLVEREDLIEDPRFKDDITRASNCETINEIMSAWCAARSRDEVVAEMERARIPCGPVYDLGEVLSDPQVSARNLIRQVEYPSGGNPIPVSNTPVRLSETPGSIRHGPPMLGEHTIEVLRELGFSADEIETLRESGAI
jgi:crotonobetainyl-CoA:carnitine CoA-transferase CaiB-like acyl-CoA transferase